MTQYFDLAEYYDYDQAFDFDLAFYQEYAGNSRMPLLEFGCGTGRLTVPLAQAGFEIYGLDLSDSMLQRCQTAVKEYNLQDRVHLSLADMSNFELPRKDFGLAFVALRSFMHLLERSQQRDCLRCVYDHLRPGALFIVDVIAPDLDKLAQKPGPEYFVRNEFDLPGGNRVIRQIRLCEHDRINQVRHFEFKFAEYDPAGHLLHEEYAPVSTRYIFRYEMQLLLETAGFAVVDVFRDHEMNPYDGTGEMIVVARR